MPSTADRAGVPPWASEAEMETYCPGCREVRPFETPPCDEHGADCPELACVICGWALVGPVEIALVPRRARALGA
ncbi:MAG TPA: hypothetical protein VMI11_06500 [Actinomycetes bacterium]|nr:hypothetical protein [Actinomycetes bacterium]